MIRIQNIKLAFDHGPDALKEGGSLQTEYSPIGFNST